MLSYFVPVCWVLIGPKPVLLFFFSLYQTWPFCDLPPFLLHNLFIIAYLKSDIFLCPISSSSCYSFCFLKCSFSDLTLISRLHFSSSMDFCLPIVCTMPLSFPLMSFLWCSWNITAITSSALSSIGFVYSVHFHFLALRYYVVFEIVHAEFPRCGIILFSVVRRPTSFPSSCFCTFLYSYVHHCPTSD